MTHRKDTAQERKENVFEDTSSENGREGRWEPGEKKMVKLASS